MIEPSEWKSSFFDTKKGQKLLSKMRMAMYRSSEDLGSDLSRTEVILKGFQRQVQSNLDQIGERKQQQHIKMSLAGTSILDEFKWCKKLSVRRGYCFNSGEIVFRIYSVDREYQSLCVEVHFYRFNAEEISKEIAKLRGKVEEEGWVLTLLSGGREW